MDINAFYNRAYNWLYSFGPKFIIAVIILLGGLWLIRTFRRWLNYTMVNRNVDPSLRPFFISLIGVFLQVMLALGIMQIVGIQLTIFAALIGAFGVAAGLALSGTLQNFTSGILILLLKPFRVGDNIIAQGHDGIVMEIRIFYTVMKALDNRIVIIPNSKLSNEVIVNLSREGKRRLDIELKLSFGIQFEQVNSILERIINAHPDLLKDPAFSTGVSAIEADGYKVMITVWVKALDYQYIKLELQETIVREITQAEIKLPGMV